LVGEICGAKAKADFLLSHCELLNILPSHVVAMGDGANDLLMMNEAGLSIAYHAKPTVQEQATSTLNYCGLEGVLGLLQLDF
jgi:phosphoserine phosphatase